MKKTQIQASHQPYGDKENDSQYVTCWAVLNGVCTRLISGGCDGVYTGYTQYDKCNGLGFLHCANGDKYEGEFKDGKFNGYGFLHCANDYKYEGEFKDGKFNGKGVLTVPRVGVYDGEFKDGKKHGKGVFNYANGDVFNGEFKDGAFNGKGVWSFTGGSVYTGTFRNGAFHDDEMVIRQSNGNVEKAGFKDGIRHGKFTTLNASGYLSEGVYENGRVIRYTEPRYIMLSVEPQEEKSKEDFDKALACYPEVKHLLKRERLIEKVHNTNLQSNHTDIIGNQPQDAQEESKESQNKQVDLRDSLQKQVYCVQPADKLQKESQNKQTNHVAQLQGAQNQQQNQGFQR